MNRTAVIDVVGLDESLIGPHTPRIEEFLAAGRKSRIVPAFPAVTCTAQSTYLTGETPAQHGSVANGWYHRELSEVQFWKQSNRLIAGKKIWEEMRELDPAFTCAKLFWWYNMYATADFSITPRPMYPADGRKFFDIYSWPYGIRTEIKKELGEFPFPTFWGPAAGMKSPQGEPDACSRWIAEAARWIENKHAPTLNLIYLPHLDYNLQRRGPNDPSITTDLRQIDAIVGGLIDFFAARKVQVILLSEYGITAVDTPIHINRALRKAGLVTIKEELGLELIDYGASKAFAVADHQVAHIYIKDRNEAVAAQVRKIVEGLAGVDQVLDRAAQAGVGIDHERSGDLIAVAKDNAWFTYYYWFDDAKAPDFARCVDIHRKPGYDPVELFLDPKIAAVKLKILWRLLKKKLGFRMLMDVIPLDATLVKGSHGARPRDPKHYPLVISSRKELLPIEQIEATDVYQLIRRHLLH